MKKTMEPGDHVQIDRARRVFDNPITAKEYRSAVRSKKKFVRKFGDDAEKNYAVKLEENPHIGEILGVRDLRVNEGAGDIPFDEENGIIVGNIRMGFGHYRIAMAMASCAQAMGYTPYWMDLNSYPGTACTKVISKQNDLYSLGSRISQRSRLFNKLIWEPVNYEGFRKISYNAADQKNAELMAPVFQNVPKNIPFIGTHSWPSQAALHGGMKYVVNAIPDNWPMALHFAEGSVHTVQTHFAYQGYRILNGMRKKQVLRPIPEDQLLYTGHYVDDELVRNIEVDCAARMKRKEEGKPMRFLLTIGGAGAQKELFAAVIRYLLPYVREGRAALYINVGDYAIVWKDLLRTIPEMESLAETHFEDWEDSKAFCEKALTEDVTGIHAFCHKNVFEAVYVTNLLLRSTDVMLTKPSELAFYPVPKLFLKRIGGHEQWNAIHSCEIGDGTLECRDIPHTEQMLDLFLNDSVTLKNMCECILHNKKLGTYDGGYQVVEAAIRRSGREPHAR